MPIDSRLLRRLWPLALLGIAVAAAFALGAHRHLTLETLRANRDGLLAFTAAYPVVSPLILGVVYVAVVACSLPGATALTITCGFLLGPVWGTLHAVSSATLGASLLFAIASTSLGRSLRHRADSWVGRFQAGFQKNAFNYLLILRLIPLFPFFIVNLVPALLGVRLRVFVAGTFIGSMPGSFVYASFGAGLSAVLASGAELSASDVLTPEVLTALIGLAALAAAPVIYRRLRPAAAAPAEAQALSRGGARLD